jgi:hypothetical protein
MALYYEFDVDLDPQPKWDEALREMLFAMGRPELTSALISQGDGAYVNCDDFDLSCAPMSTHSPRVEILKEELDISVNFRFRWRVSKFSKGAEPQLFRGVNHWFGKSSGDAVFYFNGDIVYLMRRGGQLYLNNAPGMWTPYWLQFITQPYEMLKIPVL